MHFLNALITALVWVESGGDPNAVGDGGKSVGCLQIGAACVADVNRFYATNYQWPEDAFDPEKARNICRLYLTHYLQFVQNPGPQDAARIWNGGPHGNLKRQTVDYWRRVAPLYAAACRGMSSVTALAAREARKSEVGSRKDEV